MTTEISDQKIERQEYLERILSSDAAKKIIVAGPGTGKTYTFNEMLRKHGGENNLIMTFIRKLIEQINDELGDLAEVKTFHAYCKKIFHKKIGKVELVPYLTVIIERDAKLLGKKPADFDAKFQRLEEDSSEIKFYLARGDYYEVVSGGAFPGGYGRK